MGLPEKLGSMSLLKWTFLGYTATSSSDTPIYGGFLSHGGTPIAGWIISWIISWKIPLSDDEQGYPHGLETSIDVLFHQSPVRRKKHDQHDQHDLNELALLQ